MRNLALIMAAALCITTPAAAQNTLIIDDGDNSVVSGVVESIRYDQIELDVGGKIIDVDVDDLEIKDDIDTFFPVGTKVRVTGRMIDSDEIEAQNIIKLEDAETEVQQ